MCYAIKIVHFGCLGGDQHVEYAVVRCKGGLEYIMLMPIKETCKGTKSVEDWRMEPCRFCKEYMETRRRSGPTSGRSRAMSLPTNAPTGTEESDVAADIERHSI
jgi:hypothetical protein